MNHLRDLHSIGPEGTIVRPPRSQLSTPSPGRAPSMLDSYCAAASERNAAAAAFDHEIFRGLLTRFFVTEQIPLQKVELQALRDLLI
jgi:hypothetical protein